MYFSYKSFVKYMYCECFLQVCGLPFHSLDDFDEQKFYILM